VTMFKKLFEKTDDIFKPVSKREASRRDQEHPMDITKPIFYTSRGMAYYSVKDDGAEPAGCEFCDNWTYMQTCEPEEEGDECYYACPDCIKKFKLPYDGPLDGAEEPIISWTDKSVKEDIFQPAEGEDYIGRKAVSLCKAVVETASDLTPGNVGPDEEYAISGDLFAEIFNFIQNNNL
jgi:hypothetical protein